jgi:hypothetical protein
MDAIFPDTPVPRVSAAIASLSQDPPDVTGALGHLGAEA